VLRKSTTLAFALALAACSDAPRTAEAPDATDATDASEGGEAPDTSPETVAAARCELPEGAAVSLPADDQRHQAATEWYYWTGHLRAEDGRWFGFHITVLIAGPPGRGVMLAHHSLTRAGGGEGIGAYVHGFEAGFERGLPAAGFAFEVGDVRVSGNDGEDLIATELDGIRLELTASDVRGPVVRHGNGYHDYGSGIATWYYARPRMAASGSLVIDGETLRVSGTVWFDHQWGTLASPDTSRWDWIAMQLDDGRELMVMRLPLSEGGPAHFGYAELTERDCTTRVFLGDEVALSGRKTWVSEASGCAYPVGWEVTVGDMRFDLEPLAEDQEMHAEPIPYWEGAATVSGSAAGRAYVELVGYCP
jgi:predicted secreted hydrolase